MGCDVDALGCSLGGSASVDMLFLLSLPDAMGDKEARCMEMRGCLVDEIERDVFWLMQFIQHLIRIPIFSYLRVICW